jgi:hypothetical protein
MRNPDKMSHNELRLVVKAWRKGLSRLASPEAMGPVSRVATLEETTRMEYAQHLLEVAEL